MCPGSPDDVKWPRWLQWSMLLGCASVAYATGLPWYTALLVGFCANSLIVVTIDVARMIRGHRARS